MEGNVAAPTIRKRLTDLQEWHVESVGTFSERALLTRDDRPQEPVIRIWVPWVPPLASSSAKEWFSAVADAIGRLLALPHGWDSYGAPRIDPRCAEQALKVAFRIVCEYAPPRPSVVPTSNGGIQLEWHKFNIDLEVEFVPPGRMCVFFEDLRSGKTWEKELPSDDIKPILEAVSALSR